MRTALLISTYNSPEFLRLVLDTVQTQARVPDQVVIADDGSTESTRRVIDRFRDSVSFPVQHCWQADDGFRKTRILNRAIQKIDCDYVILSDGDMLLHPAYVNDHIELADPGFYVQGRRVCLNRSATKQRLKTSDTAIRIWHRGINRRPQMIRSRFLMRCASSRDTGLKNSRGCNQAFWREDLVAVNGYEESMEGWGREDSEVCARLHNLGRRRIYARHFALAYHLYHDEASRERDSINQSILDETIRTRRVRAIKGLDQNCLVHAA